MNILPLRDKIIVKPEQKLKSTLWIQTAEADSVGYVVAAGPDAINIGLNVGDKIHFGTYNKDYSEEYLKFEELQIDGERHLKLSWQDVCFVEEVD
jgi:co-chaperonin GroES (HSP10)